MQIGTVKDDRGARDERKIEFVLQLLVGFLRKGRSHFGQLLHLRIKVDIKMIRLQDMPVKVLILNLVAPKMKSILRLKRRSPQSRPQKHQ